MNKGLSVYVRHRDASSGAHLCDVSSAHEVDVLVKDMTRCGIYTGDDVHYKATTQYVLEDGRAFYEVIVG